MPSKTSGTCSTRSASRRPTPEQSLSRWCSIRRAAGVVRERLARAGVTPGHRVIVIHVSAGNPFRRWPLDSFASLVAQLVRGDASRRVIVISGPSERAAAAQVIERARALVAPAGARAHPQLRRVQSRRSARARRPRRALHRRRQRTDAHRVDEPRSDRGAVRADAARAFRTVARVDVAERSGGSWRPAVPPVRSTDVRAGRFSLPHVAHARTRRRGCRTGASRRELVIWSSGYLDIGIRHSNDETTR